MTESLMELRQMVHSQVKRSESTIQVLGKRPSWSRKKNQ